MTEYGQQQRMGLRGMSRHSWAIALITLGLGGCSAPGVFHRAIPASNRHTVAAQEAAWEQAQQAYTHQQFDIAAQQLEPLAQAGLAKAQYALGYLCFYGKGIPINRPIAETWFRRAAEQGYGPALEALRRIHRKRLFGTDIE